MIGWGWLMGGDTYRPHAHTLTHPLHRSLIILESYRPVTSAPTLYSNPYSHNQLRTTTKDTLPRALGCSPRWFEPIHKNQITSQS